MKGPQGRLSSTAAGPQLGMRIEFFIGREIQRIAQARSGRHQSPMLHGKVGAGTTRSEIVVAASFPI